MILNFTSASTECKAAGQGAKEVKKWGASAYLIFVNNITSPRCLQQKVRKFATK